MQDVLDDLDTCIATAAEAGRTIEAEAQLYIGLWINMTGKPSTLLTWLEGGNPRLSKPIPKAGKVVDVPAIRTYLKATKFFVRRTSPRLALS